MKTLLLSVLLSGLFSPKAFCLPEENKLVAAIAGDPEVKGIVSLMQKSRNWKCGSLKAADIQASPNDQMTYLARLTCKDLTIPSNPANVLQFKIEAMYVRDVQDFTTNLIGMEIIPL